ncbi:MAG TPA: hypothetical protein VGW78_01380 [Candidatus Babeliales bacterium]|jgi:hypothetical protein|nr:hypothetical protein [Candidatus Babeliales bacterium]
MHHTYKNYLITVSFIGITNFVIAYKAVTINPVVDLIGQSIQVFYPDLPVQKAYKKIPLCAGNLHKWISCPRLHQLLYNEVVDILENNGEQVKLRIPNLFYITMHNAQPQCEYWAPATAFIASDILQQRGIDMRIIPEPIIFEQKRIKLSPHIITLIVPYHDPKTGITFSAGTRFVRVYHEKNKRDRITVTLYDPKHQKARIIHIPESYCFVPSTNTTKESQRALFIDILRTWSHMAEGFIPYVWGGCSIMHTQTGPFKEKTRKQVGQKVSYFSYGKKNKHKPYTGIDCSSLISRAAQIVGIPYFYKNSYTISRLMKPLQSHQHIENGDIIWMPGHVMIVSDRACNLTIEARSYFSGYGKVHEIEIGKVFKDINTYDQLEQAFFAKKPIHRMNIDGEILNTFTEYQLLPLAQLWRQYY